MKKQIGQLLVENGSISEHQLDLALKIQKRERHQHRPLGIILVLLNYISPEQLLKCLDQQQLAAREAVLED